MADLADSAMALRTVARQLPDEAWQFEVRMMDSALFPAAALLTRRLVEVELHHCDLGAGVRPRGLAGRLRRHGPARAHALAAPGPAQPPRAVRRRRKPGHRAPAPGGMEARPAASGKLAQTAVTAAGGVR